MGDSLPWTPMNFRAKFDAASFILDKEIRNRTNTHTQKQQTIYLHLAYRHVWIITDMHIVLVISMYTLLAHLSKLHHAS